jgi:glycosyltransferase involved in cell wall biosynthesis
MKRRVVILTEIISPYRIPLFNALGQEEGIDPHVIFLSENDPSLRQWRVYKEEIRFPYQVLPSWRKRIGKYNVLLNRGLTHALQSASPDLIVCGGYSYVASWQALWWARSNNIPFLLWSESCLQDRRSGHRLVEFLKGQFFRKCDGFIVPGEAARVYQRSWGATDESIFTAVNAVDNELFARGAEAARQNDAGIRTELNLPGRYFLFVGRLVREKGVFDLLAAYARLNSSLRNDIGLVFVGNGLAREQLEAQSLAVSPGVVKFVGFAHREQLPAYYALAESLVLPTYTDPWGLVVNEAMACGLPVVVSRMAGCAIDLVRDNWNGIVISPGDVAGLSNALQVIASRREIVEPMSSRSLELIAQYSPQSWSAGLSRAVESMESSNV